LTLGVMVGVQVGNSGQLFLRRLFWGVFEIASEVLDVRIVAALAH